jgi:hypothetical protein
MSLLRSVLAVRHEEQLRGEKPPDLEKLRKRLRQLRWKARHPDYFRVYRAKPEVRAADREANRRYMAKRREEVSVVCAGPGCLNTFRVVRGRRRKTCLRKVFCCHGCAEKFRYHARGEP